jgi:hypothetical protein
MSFYYVSIRENPGIARGNRQRREKKEYNKKRRKRSSRDWSRAETIKTHKSAAKKVAPNQTKKRPNFCRLKIIWVL